MTVQSRPLLAETDQPQATERSFVNSVASMGRRITGWFARTAASYTAAVTYEQLWQLSDHELQRRGLSRATLAHDVGQDRNPAQGC